MSCDASSQQCGSVSFKFILVVRGEEEGEEAAAADEDGTSFIRNMLLVLCTNFSVGTCANNMIHGRV